VQLPANTESYDSFHDDSVDDPGQAEAHHHITQHLVWRQSTRAQQRPLTSWSFARLQLAHQCGHSTETALLHIMNSVCVVRDHYPWHCTSAPADCHYLVAGNRLQVALKLQSFTVARPVVVSLRSLGLWFTCHKDIARACYYHTCVLRHVHSLLSNNLALTMLCSIVAFRLHYCNAMLYGATSATFDILQQAQNNLARVICQHGGPTDARPLPQSFH